LSRVAHGERGQALAVAIAVASVALAAALAAASLRPTASRSEVASASASFAARVREMSLAAIVDGSARAVVFSMGDDAEPLLFARDADGGGLTRASIDAGREETGVPFRMARDHPGVSIGLPESGTIAGIPPSSARLDGGDPPVRVGSARMLTLTPEGHATSGTIYLSGREGDVCAVVIYGATVRVRVWCHDRVGDAWRMQ